MPNSRGSAPQEVCSRASGTAFAAFESADERGGSLRSDLTSMLMPFFPEDGARSPFSTIIDGHAVTMSVEGDDERVATPGDRKVLNVLAGALAEGVRAGLEPSRRVEIDVRPLLDALSIEIGAGGTEYVRLIDRLKRLMATVIETSAPIGDGLSHHRRFRWIDGYEHLDRTSEGGRKILALRITLSEEAFALMTRSLGFDVTPSEFRAVTSTPSSTWRIYEICLAKLARARARSVTIPLAELRDRVPIASELKVFKSRTLRSAFKTIAANARMSGHISLRLEKRVGEEAEEISFSHRAPLDTIQVRVSRGTATLPRMSVMLPAARITPMNTEMTP